MFAVPGWDLAAKSLVAEKAEPKGKSRSRTQDDADPTSKKRKRAQLEVEKSRKIKASELEELWNQRFGSPKPTDKVKPKSHDLRGKAAATKVSNALQKKQTDHAQQAGQKSRKHSNNADDANAERGRSHEVLQANAGVPRSAGLPTSSEDNHAAGDKLSRKQKKLRNKLEREQDPPSTGHVVPEESDQHVPRKHKQRQGELDAKSLPSRSSRPEKDQKPEKRPTAHDASEAAASLSDLPPPPPATTTLTSLQSSFLTKLTASRFRHLNQQLYTTPSSTSLTLFASQPSLFTEYHAGFTHQTHAWPINPVTIFINSLRTRSTLSNDAPTTIPRRKTGSCTIADLGCGDAPLARALSPITKKLNLKIHSFDLHAPNSHVTVADISNLPLRDGEADIAIFCLSLMGTNWLDFVEDCWRILRGDGKGEVWVAEVKSRFGRVSRKKGEAVDNSVGKRRKQQKGKKQKDEEEDEGLGEEVFAEDAKTPEVGDETDISAFVAVFQRRGFKLKEESVDKSNKMFVSMVFHKSGVPTQGKYKGLKWNGKEYQKQQEGKKGFTNDDENVNAKDEAKVLKPCVYKTR